MSSPCAACASPLPVPQPRAPSDGPVGLDGALTAPKGEILRVVADGLFNREIAGQFCLSRYAMESYIKRVYRKLAVSSRAGAVREARLRGWLACRGGARP